MIAAGHLEHLRHARAAGRALVADHDDVARLDRLRLDRRERRPARCRRRAPGPRCCLRSTVSLTTQPSGARLPRRIRSEPLGLIGASIGRTTSWPRLLDDGGRDLAERRPADSRPPAVDESRFGELARDEPDARRRGRRRSRGTGPTASCRRARGVRAAIRSKSSIVKSDPELARDRQQVQHAVRRAAGRDDRGGGVLDRLARDDLRRPYVAADEVDDEAARTRPPPRPSSARARGSPFRPGGEIPRNSRIVDIVFAVNCPPQAPAPGQAAALELVQLLGRHGPRG